MPLRCDHDSYRDCCCDCRHNFCQCSRNSCRDLLLEVFLSSSFVCVEEQGTGARILWCFQVSVHFVIVFCSVKRAQVPAGAWESADDDDHEHGSAWLQATGHCTANGWGAGSARELFGH